MWISFIELTYITLTQSNTSSRLLRKRARCSEMDQALPSQSSASELLDPDSEELQLRVDFFRKLGYSSAEVKTALRKLGLNTDTNSVLGQLVRTTAGTAPIMSGSDGEETSAGQKDPLLPPTWALISCRIPPQINPDTELRPIVIDGSNVAIR